MMCGAHGGAVTGVAICGTIIVTGGEDGATRIWSADKQADTALPPHAKDGQRQLGMVREVQLDPPNDRLCTGAEDGFLRLWDISAGRATRRLCHLAIASETGAAQGAHDLLAVTPPPFAFRGSRLGVQAVAIDTCTPAQLGSGGCDGSLWLWDIRQSKPVEKIQAHSGALLSLSVYGERMLSASAEGSAALWDVRNLTEPLETVDLLGRMPLVVPTLSHRADPPPSFTDRVAEKEQNLIATEQPVAPLNTMETPRTPR